MTEELQWARLDGVNTHTAVAMDDIFENYKGNIGRNLPRMVQMPEFFKVKGKEKKVAIVGGGPSLKDNLDELRTFRVIIAAGSANDYLMEHGIIPTYTVLCDPDPIMARYIERQDTEVKYLVASTCHNTVYETLAGKQIIMWHCDSDELREKFKELEPAYVGVGGGSTVGLRSISMALLLGYNNLHLFGFDSCYGKDGEHHAYGFKDEEYEKLGLGETYRITPKNIEAGPPDANDPVYICAGYHLAQIHQFKDYYSKYRDVFNVTVHGDGLLAATVKLMNEEFGPFVDKVDNEQ